MKTLQRRLRALFRAPREPDIHRAARELAKRLAEAHGAEIERLRGGGFNVWPPCGLANDPYEGDHYAQDWQEVPEHVQAYVAVCGEQPCKPV